MQQSFSSRPSSFSLPRPSPQDFIPYASVNPRRLARLEPPPVLIRDYPALPCTRPPPFVPSYEVTTHVLPAAFPRAPSEPWTPPPPHETSAQKKERIRRSVDTFSALKVRQEQGRDPRPSRREVLWSVANRYVCTARRATPGLTLVMMHGIGAHKEVRVARTSFRDFADPSSPFRHRHGSRSSREPLPHSPRAAHPSTCKSSGHSTPCSMVIAGFSTSATWVTHVRHAMSSLHTPLLTPHVHSRWGGLRARRGELHPALPSRRCR